MPSLLSNSESWIKSKITFFKVKRRTYEFILEFFKSFAQNKSPFFLENYDHLKSRDRETPSLSSDSLTKSKITIALIKITRRIYV